MSQPIAVPEGRPIFILDQRDLDRASEGGPREVAEHFFGELMLRAPHFEEVDAGSFFEVVEAIGDLPCDEYENGVELDPDLAAACLAVAKVFADYAGGRVLPPGSGEGSG